MANKLITMKISSNNQITLNKRAQKCLKTKPGDTVVLNPITKKLVKMPTIDEWKKAIKHIPHEHISFNSNGTINTKKTPNNICNWLKEG